MVLKAAVQALKKAEQLKIKVSLDSTEGSTSGNSNLLSDSSLWSAQQQLTSALHQVLVLDLDYALDQKVEQDLWMLGFKNYIAALQVLTRDKKNPKRQEAQALLSWCLESASGFYLTLLQELCETFQLDLPFRRQGIAFGGLMCRQIDQVATPPQRSSCLYICQYCLVHLGDIARYRNQRKQAESFYRHAILLSPSSGQPYNQLALLQASRGDKLATVFYYVRSVALAHPFPPATSNLAKTLELASNDEKFTNNNAKLTISEFTNAFIKLHGLLYIAYDLTQAEVIVKSLTSALTALVATDSFTSLKLIQMFAINLFVIREPTENISNKELSKDEKQVRHLVHDLIAGIFNACLLPIYTIRPSNLLQYFALPSIKLTLEWIRSQPSILSESVFLSRLQIWPSLCKLLNLLHLQIKDFDYKPHVHVPLPEDRDLQGFLPLVKAFRKIDFSSDDLKTDAIALCRLRAARIVQLGQYIATIKVNNTNLIKYREMKDKNEIVFETVGCEGSPTSDILKELEMIKIENNVNLSPSYEKYENSDSSAVSSMSDLSFKAQDKNCQKLRTGILKPQGSLERAREEREQAMLLNNTSSEVNTTTPTKNPNTPAPTATVKTSGKKTARQNVAMQAILRKVEENSKQVKFVTEDNDSDKKVNKTEQRSQNATANKDTPDLSAKKGSAGILALKNQYGYPHLVNTSQEKPDVQNMQLNTSQMNNFPRPENVHSSQINFPNTKTENTVPQQAQGFSKSFNLNFSPLPFAQNSQSFPNNQQNMALGQNKKTDFVDPNLLYGKVNLNNYQQPNKFTGSPVQNNTPFNYPPIKKPPEFNLASQIPQHNMSSPIKNNRDILSANVNFPHHQHMNSNVSNPMFGQQFSNNQRTVGLPMNENQYNFSPFQTQQNNAQFNQNPFAKLPNDPHNQQFSMFPQRSTEFMKNNQTIWSHNEKVPMPPTGWWSNNGGKPDYPYQNSLNNEFMKNVPSQWSSMSEMNNSSLMYETQQNMFIPQINRNQNFFNENKFSHQRLFNGNNKDFNIKPDLKKDETKLENMQPQQTSPPGYSLFNSNWAPNLSSASTSTSPALTPHSEPPGPAMLGQQSLFSGPGPSALERLLEQQKQLRGVPPKEN